MAKRFETYNDYETASYFHQRCLDISIEFKYIEGEALAHKGLGNAEEKVFNKLQAMDHLEIARGKVEDTEYKKTREMILIDLVRIYQLIADESLDKVRSLLTQTTPLDAEDEHLKQDALDQAKRFFQKCLDVSIEMDFKRKVAECHQSLGQIHEINGNLDMAIEARKKFLEITKDDNSPEGLRQQVEAYK